MTDQKKTCETCRWWGGNPRIYHHVPTAECCRHSPLTLGDETHWPRTYQSQTCGDWEAKVDPGYPRWFRNQDGPKDDLKSILYRFDDPESLKIFRVTPVPEGMRHLVLLNLQQCVEHPAITEIDGTEAEKILAGAKKPPLPEIHDAECCGTCKHWEKVVFFDGNCMRREQKPVTIIKHCSLYERKETA